MDVTGEMQPGRIFARDFRVERLLASGGMGAVYVVEQLSTGKRRALKVLFPQFVRDEAGRRRFAQEARLGAEIDSDHVVDVVGAGIDEATGVPWLAMELLEGQDLASYVQSRGRLDVATVREVMEQLCDALARAHAKGVVHRDLKPENLFVAAPRRRGVPFTLKVLDFGIAKIVQENRAAATGSMTIGSPLWMAPEQAVTAAPISPRTDVWSLGLIAYWLYTGTWYWQSAQGASFNLPALLVEVMTAPIEPASQRGSAAGVAALLPQGFDGWFARCVSRDPATRFADAGAAHEALARLAGGVATQSATVPLSVTPPPPMGTMPMPTVATPPSFSKEDRPGVPLRRMPSWVWIGAASLLGVTALAIGAVWKRGNDGADTQRVMDAPPVTRLQTEVQSPPVPVSAPPSLAPPPAERPVHRAPTPRAGSGVGFVRESPYGAPVANGPPGEGAVHEPPSGGEIVRERIVRGNASLGEGGAESGEGEIDANRVASLIRRQIGGIRSCYERWLRINPTLAGRIDVRFTIGRSGGVTSIRPSGMSEAPEVGTCIANVIRRIAFPQPSGGSVEFSFPFTFSPGG